MSKLYYGVFKNYKGLIFKTYISNSHVLFVPADNKFYIFLLLGYNENDPSLEYAAQIYSDDITKMDEIVKYYKNKVKKFYLVESILCNSIVKNDTITINLNNPSEFIQSKQIKIKYYEKGTTTIEGNKYFVYTIRMKFNPLEKENMKSLKYVSDLKMMALKKLAFFKAFYNNDIRSTPENG